MLDYNSPYTDMFLSDAKRQLRKIMSRKTVLHHQTCQCCGRTLVNLYWSEQAGYYMCKKCLDKFLSKESSGNAE